MYSFEAPPCSLKRPFPPPAWSGVDTQGEQANVAAATIAGFTLAQFAFGDLIKNGTLPRFHAEQRAEEEQRQRELGRDSVQVKKLVAIWNSRAKRGARPSFYPTMETAMLAGLEDPRPRRTAAETGHAATAGYDGRRPERRPSGCQSVRSAT